MNKTIASKNSLERSSQIREFFLQQANAEKEKEESRRRVMENQFQKATEGKKLVIKGNIK